MCNGRCCSAPDAILAHRASAGSSRQSASLVSGIASRGNTELGPQTDRNPTPGPKWLRRQQGSPLTRGPKEKLIARSARSRPKVAHKSLGKLTKVAQKISASRLHVARNRSNLYKRRDQNDYIGHTPVAAPQSTASDHTIFSGPRGCMRRRSSPAPRWMFRIRKNETVAPLFHISIVNLVNKPAQRTLAASNGPTGTTTRLATNARMHKNSSEKWSTIKWPRTACNEMCDDF